MFKSDLQQKSHEASSIKYSPAMQYSLKTEAIKNFFFKKLTFKESHMKSGPLNIALLCRVY